MDEGISKHTITILVILTVIISFLGTWTVMNEVSKIKADSGDNTNTAVVPVQQTTARVGITIVDPQTTKGKVSVDIK